MSQYIPFLNYNVADILTLFGEPSLSTFYMVFLPVGEVGSNLANAFKEAELYNTSKDGYRLEEKMSLLCSDATLPGSTFNTVEVRGNRQGITERVANYKIYPPVDFSFMVDAGHSVIRLFETWMGFISPLNGDPDDPTSYYKFRYPDEYILEDNCFSTHKDHRIAMSLAPISLLFPMRIEDPEVVDKSYPEFWQHFAEL